MALQTESGYIRIAYQTGFDEKSMQVFWRCYLSQDWEGKAPTEVYPNILREYHHTFDLAIKEMQNDAEGNQIEVITGYLPQTLETAHNLLKNLNVQGHAEFSEIPFEIVELTQATPAQEFTIIWRPNLKVNVGEVYRILEAGKWKSYEVIQAHVTQAQWVPSLTPALWKVWSDPNVISEWIQPTGAHDAYNIGDRVSYQGVNYESTVNANVYAPLVVAGQWITI